MSISREGFMYKRKLLGFGRGAAPRAQIRGVFVCRQLLARCMSIWYMNVYFCDIYITARPRTSCAAAWPELTVYTSNATGQAFLEPADRRGALWEGQGEPAAAKSCSPTATRDQSTLKCTIPRSARCRIVDRGTQWMVLSAAINNPTVCCMRDGTFQHHARLS